MKDSKPKHVGDFEFLVLTAILRLSDQAYGVAISREIEQRTGRSASFGAIYTTLDRLKKKALVSSRLGEATQERGGRSKTLYSVTKLGLESMQLSLGALRRMIDGVEALQ
ncbi:MAG: hypothetical protein DHS20C11_35330 [Lysobacteraceae bacterium]|nr:MAG: hypothetical protein DHS20C11_35330 [Xanthomonadaceae bacterium]